MTSPNTKSSLAVIVAVAGLLLTGWASAQQVDLPKGAVCKVVRTTVESDKQGRVVIITKKVCEVK